MLTIIKSNKRLADYGARLRRREATPAIIDIYTAWPAGGREPFIGTTWRHAWKRLTLEIELRGTWNVIEENKAKLHADLISGTLKFDDEPGRIYTYAMDGAPGQSEQFDGFYETLTYNLMAYKMDQSPTVTAVTTTQKTITLDSPLPAKTTVTLNGSGTVQLVINGETIVARNMVAGTPRIIGDGQILQGGVNKWDDTDLPGGAFPEIQPGANTAKTVNGTASIATLRRHF